MSRLKIKEGGQWYYTGYGESGTSGYSGSGISGYSGSGISGYSGYSGEVGAEGLSGFSGAAGATGATGTSGYSGSGISGYSGESGYSGISGYSGYAGASGVSGTIAMFNGTSSLISSTRGFWEGLAARGATDPIPSAIVAQIGELQHYYQLISTDAVGPGDTFGTAFGVTSHVDYPGYGWEIVKEYDNHRLWIRYADTYSGWDEWHEIAQSLTPNTSNIEFIIDGGGYTIASGIKGDLEIPFTCLITQWTLLADQTGSINLDVWNAVYSSYPPVVGGVIISGAAISSAVKNQTGSLSIGVVAGSTLRIYVNSASAITRCTLSLKVTRL